MLIASFPGSPPPRSPQIKFFQIKYLVSTHSACSCKSYVLNYITCTRKLISSKGGGDPWDSLVTCGCWWRVYQRDMHDSTLFATAAKIHLSFYDAHQRTWQLQLESRARVWALLYVCLSFQSHRKINQSHLTMSVDLLLNSWFYSYPRVNIAWAMKCHNATTSQIRHYIGPVVSAGGQDQVAVLLCEHNMRTWRNHSIASKLPLW